MMNRIAGIASFMAVMPIILLAAACTSGAGIPDAAVDAGVPVGDSGFDAGDKSASIAAGVSRENFAGDLSAVAIPREPGSANWQMVQDMIAGRLKSLGFEVERHVYDTGVNVIGVKKGVVEGAKEVMISAHYDHVAGCAGADDNASGVAGALEAARVLGGHEYEKTLVVAFWDEEEKYLVGSRAYAERASERKEPIAVSIVFEMIGYRNTNENSQKMPTGFDYMFPDQCAWLEEHGYRGDFVLLAGDNLARGVIADMSSYAGGEELPAVVIELNKEQKKDPLMYALRRSDHESFWQFNYPAIMVTDTADQRNLNYHCKKGPDSVDRLDPDFAVMIVKSAVAAAARLLVTK
jgi:hypothetical protein